MNRKNYVLMLLGVTLVCVALAVVRADILDRIETAEPAVQIVFLNPGQLQSLLNHLEPNSPLKVDYVAGPQTNNKWNRVWNNASAAPHFKGQE